MFYQADPAIHKGVTSDEETSGCDDLCCGVFPLWAQGTEKTRLKESFDVLNEILKTPDRGIPRDPLEKAECAVVFPSVKKAAFVVGASYGRGEITWRSVQSFDGPWSGPSIF